MLIRKTLFPDIYFLNKSIKNTNNFSQLYSECKRTVRTNYGRLISLAKIFQSNLHSIKILSRNKHSKNKNENIQNIG